MADRFVQNAIVSEGQCKQKNCHQECKKSCNAVHIERGLCIMVTPPPPASKTTVSPGEFGIYVKRYPFEAVQIINLPRELVEDTTHWLPRMRQVLGLVGTLRPNLGRLDNPQNWQKYLTHFHGSELESYLTQVVEENLKPQHVDQIKKIVNMLDERGMLVQICADRRAKEVLGGEMHEWFAIAKALIEKAETCMLDESHLLKCGEVTTMSDLPDDLAEEILSRVPLTTLSAVRSTCTKWNALSKNMVLGKSAAGRNQFLGFMLKNYKVCSMKFDLQGIGSEAEFVDPSVKEVSILDQVEITQVFHCEGLLLCVTKDRSRLLVWNPYLGQTRWVQPRNTFHSLDRFAIGYDKNRNYKILRVFGKYDTKGEHGCIDKYLVFGYETYDLSSSSWKVFNFNLDRNINSHQRGVSLNGHTYFLAEERWTIGRRNKIEEIISFDFTTERFGKGLLLPFKSGDVGQFVSLSCVREEQLAVLHQSSVSDHTSEIWVTSKIDDLGAVSWTKFLRSTSCCCVDFLAGSFFIDEEKKVAVVIDLDDGGQARTETRYNQRACIMGQDEYFKPVNVGEALNHGKRDKFGFVLPVFCCPLVCPYVPSSAQLQLQPGKLKEGDD